MANTPYRQVQGKMTNEFTILVLQFANCQLIYECLYDLSFSVCQLQTAK
jgi:hypothetical protein